MHKTIGVVGGMGPYATIDLFQKIVAHTPAATDQQHLRVIILNNPGIPPRSNILDADMPSPLPELKASCILLERAGADFLIMPCHTAHIWHEALQAAVGIPLISMIENTVETMRRDARLLHRRILLLASAATVAHRLYQHAFAELPFELVVPAPEEQRIVDAAILDAKAGNWAVSPHLPELDRIVASHMKKGATALLDGCTEIPLLVSGLRAKPLFVDSTLMLAKTAIRYAVQPNSQWRLVL